LYNGIVCAVFDGHQLEIVCIPWKRSMLEVKNGTADITRATSAADGYISSRFVMLASPISVLFDKRKINYNGLHSLEKHVVVWPSIYEDELIPEYNKAFIKSFSVQERETAYQLLVSGRTDYFLDVRWLHQA
jgi:hypothetical protein